MQALPEIRAAAVPDASNNGRASIDIKRAFPSQKKSDMAAELQIDEVGPDDEIIDPLQTERVTPAATLIPV